MISGSLHQYLTESAQLLNSVAESIGQGLIEAAIDVTVTALASGKPLLVCGNGGSAADASHIAGELVGRFFEERRALKVICLCSDPSVLTSCSNDHGFETAFARQVEAYGEPGAVLMGLSTSGNSANVVAAFRQARRMNMATIAFTGQGGGHLAPFADFLLAVPSGCTPLIQQVHLCLYHYLCCEVERRMMMDEVVTRD